MKRREFFNSLSSSILKEKKEKESLTIRPPYYKDEALFYEQCSACEAPCVSACEEEIICISENKTVFIDFSKGGCTYCAECAKVCPNEVLQEQFKDNFALNFEIDMLRCLSWNNTMCFSCKDPCLDEAIDFLGMFRPSINESCTSCGFCLSICPTNAISYKRVEK